MAPYDARKPGPTAPMDGVDGKHKPTKITALTNGPLLVEGHPTFVDQNGKPYLMMHDTKFALCRCGGSATKPFCDGTHAKNGFQCPAQP